MVRLATIALLLALVGAISIAQPKTIRVPQDHATIQAAINAAVNGDTVLVAEGTYYENVILKKKIVLGSLFVVDKNPSHIANTILDGSRPRHQDSASVILVSTGSDSTTVVSGFTIQRGRGTRFYFAPDYWRAGGGIVVFGGGARISHNVIRNDSLISTDGVYGGGITVDPHDGPLSYWIIEHNQILNNVISTSGGAAEGAGVWLTEDGRFTHNVVEGNSASAAVLYASGGGANIIGATGYGSSTIQFSDNVLRNNSAKWGGALALYTDPTLTAIPTVSFVNNVIVSNTASLLGSVMHCNSGDYSFVNNTIALNVGPSAFQLNAGRGSLFVRFLNTIIWNPGSTNEFNNAGLATGSYNLVRGGFAGTGNISDNPKFVIGDSLYRLDSTSAAIGKGTLSAIVGTASLTASAVDYLGLPRPQPASTNPDLGAIEHERENPASGVNDTDVIPADFALEQNYPNPFNPATVISYTVAAPSGVEGPAQIRLAVYDLLGREVAVLVDEEKPAGVYTARWDAAGMPSGMYFYTLTAGSFMQTGKMVLLK